MPIIDVRDLAYIHFLMISSPTFNKHGRYLIGSESMWFKEIIEILKKNQNKRITTRVLGPYTIFLFGLISPQLRMIYPFLNQKMSIEMD